MMKKLLVALSLSLMSSLVLALEAPDALVKRVTQEVLDIIRTDKDIQNGHTQKIISMVEVKVLPNFDFNRMTALAVGKDWRKATPPQREKLVEQFKTLLVRTYANAVSSYKEQKVVFKPYKPGKPGEEALVRTEIVQPGGKPIELDYSLEQQNANADWKVIDVVVAGVSLVTNYRGQFAQEVNNGGIDGLIAALETKNKSLESPVKAAKK